MIGLIRRSAWFLVPLVAVACSDDAGENLSDSGFTTGGESESTSMTGVTSNTTAGTTTAGTTTDSTTTDPTVGTESTTSTTDSTTTDTTTGTTDPTTSGNTTDTTGSTPGCGDGSVDDNEVCFPDSATYAVGTAPSDVVGGDFDGDNNMDVATANGGSNNVSVLLGAGDGTVGSAANVAVGTTPSRIRADELSGDTRDDIATANAGSANVSVLLASAGGGFDAAANLTVGTTPVDIGLGDIAGGGLDIAVGNSGSDNFHVLTNNGSGVFTVDGPYTSGATNIIAPTAIAIGTIALAGQDDVWYAGGGRYGASPGAAGGAIDDSISVQGVTGSALARADAGFANGDAASDIVTVDADRAVYYQNMADNSASFTPQTLTAGTGPSEAVFGDVTGEGDLDVVVSNFGSDNVSIFVGDGTGGFADAANIACGDEPSGVAVVDLNEDGVGDIVCSNETPGMITVLLSDP